MRDDTNRDDVCQRGEGAVATCNDEVLAPSIDQAACFVKKHEVGGMRFTILRNKADGTETVQRRPPTTDEDSLRCHDDTVNPTGQNQQLREPVVIPGSAESGKILKINEERLTDTGILTVRRRPRVPAEAAQPGRAQVTR